MVGGLEGVEVGEHGQHDRDADGNRDGGDEQPDERLPAAAQGELQAEAVH